MTVSAEIVTVLCMKWGAKYGPDYVNRLYGMVARHLRRPFRFVCLTDDALIAYVLALTRVWWGPPGEPSPPSSPPHPTPDSQKREPFVLQSVIVGLVVLILAAGVWPDALQMLLGGRP